MDGAPIRQPADPSSNEGRLDSWKDIAAYLKRSVPTVQRWEKEEGLPVHRHLHKKQGSIYAYRQELDLWIEQRRLIVDRGEEAEAIAEVPPEAEPSSARRWKSLALLAVVAIVLASVTGYWYRTKSRSAMPAHRTMIAVLPFQNLGGGADLDYVCDGLTEELITELAALDPNRLGIIARTSSTMYKGGGTGVRDIGRQLGVEYLVEGSVLFAPGKSRVTVQLIRVADQSHVWAHTYDSNIDNLLEVEQEISRAVAEDINVRVSSPRTRPVARVSSDPEAYRLYLEGRALWQKRSKEALEQSIALYEQAIVKDPKFAPLYSAMADSYNQLGYLGFRPLGVAIPKAQDAARHALELDPESSEANAALGFLNAMWLWDWKEAETRYQRALELDPNNAGAHHYYALYLASANRLPEATEQMAIAQQLDPLEPSVNSGSAYVLYFDRQYERSIEFCRRALQRDAGFAIAHELLGWNYLQLKRYPEAIAELKRAFELAPESTLYLAQLGRAYTLDGQREEADHVLTQLDELAKSKWVGASAPAIIYAARNDRDETIRRLDMAAKQEDGYLLWLKVSPEFDSLRDDPRFQQIEAKIGLPPGGR